MKKDKEFFRGALIGALAMFCVIAGGNALWKWASMAGFLPESLSATSEVENKLYLLEQMVDKYYLYHDEIDKDTPVSYTHLDVYKRQLQSKRSMKSLFQAILKRKEERGSL